MAKLVIFQNYYTPYRDKLFSYISKKIPIAVVYMHYPQDEGRKWTVKECEYKTIQLKRKKIGPFIFSNTKPLKKTINKGDKIVFLDNLPTNLTTLYLTYRYKKQNSALWVEHINNLDSSKVKQFAREILSKLLIRKVRVVIVFSSLTAQYIKKLSVNINKSFRSYQSYYTETELKNFRKEIKSKSLDEVYFGFLGYFIERKGILEIIEVFKSISKKPKKFKKFKKAHLIIAGDGPLKDKIKELVKDSENIHLKPYLQTDSQKAEFFNSIHFLILPSRKEPWGLVVNEALSRGVPAVVSREVGAKEIVQKIDRNLVIDMDNAKEEIEKIIENTKKYEKLSSKALEVSKKYSIEKAGKAFIDFYSGK